MPQVHPTAIIEGDVDLADDVVVGPHCVLTGPITVGAGCRFVGNVYLYGPLKLGRENVVYPFVCLGFAPQHASYDRAKPGRGLEIGDGNTFREHVTVHRSFTDEGPTRIGDGNVFMVNSHTGHDCRIGSGCTFANSAAIAGHVSIEDGVIVGGNASVHQFCRLGRGSMVSGMSGVTLDLPPWFLATGINFVPSVNLVGLRRSGVSRDVINEVKWVYGVLCRQGLTANHALEVLRERADSATVAEYVRFIESSTRGIAVARGKAARGTASG